MHDLSSHSVSSGIDHGWLCSVKYNTAWTWTDQRNSSDSVSERGKCRDRENPAREYSILFDSYNLRPVSDKELHKANGRIDEKIVRQQQQPPKPKQEPPPPPAKAKQESKPAPTTRSSTTSNSARSLMNTAAPSTTNEEYSIFRDRPPAAAQPPSTRVIYSSVCIVLHLSSFSCN